MIQCDDGEKCNPDKKVCELKNKWCKSDFQCGVNKACVTFLKFTKAKHCVWRDFGGAKHVEPPEISHDLLLNQQNYYEKSESGYSGLNVFLVGVLGFGTGMLAINYIKGRSLEKQR